jgi:3-phenylpropionate/trans-cinnamate dioxygenase ferredoxin reductase component
VTLGIKTTVLEVGPRILARVCDEETGAIIADTHRRHGVDLHTAEMIEQVRPHDAGIDVETKSGKKFTADVVVVGAGVKPNIALAAAAGLETGDGIVVDEHCRTSDPAILACGDAVRFPGPAGPIRLENWRHAQDHGMVAGRNAAGGAETYKSVPSFWSEQYDLYIQGVGWPAAQPRPRVHRTVEGGRPMVFELADGAIAYAMGINVQRDLAVARRLIERKVPVDAAALADPGQPLVKMLG